MADEKAHDWVAHFDQVFDQPESMLQQRIWGQVLGDEYPRALAPYSYTTWTELCASPPTCISATITCCSTSVAVVEAAGLWIAATSGSSYVGVDIAESALTKVRERAARLGLDAVRTAMGSFEDLPIGNGEADAVMSIDALLFTPDKQSAMEEISRVLRPGGRLVLTTWDYSRQPAGRPPQVADHRPILEAAGFTISAYDDTPDWGQRQRGVDTRLLANVTELAAESGEDPEAVQAEIEEMAATVDAMIWRVYIAAQKS